METQEVSKYSVKNIRKVHPRAYERWTGDEDDLLIKKYEMGLSNLELATLLGRQQGAIQSRLRLLLTKFESSGLNNSGINFLSVSFRFDWISIFRYEGVPYLFPEKITGFMKQNYGRPAVYRWNIYKDIPMDQKRFYIGQTTKLCPDRLNGYLSPGPTQVTNNRLNTKFKNLIKNGYKVHLELMRINKLSISDITLTSADLHSRHIRLFIESLLIIYYLKRGNDLINM